MAGVPTRVLGVDPGLVATGWALLESRAIEPAVVDCGVIETSADLPLETRVHAIYDGLHAVLEKHAPELLVLEGLYAEYRFPQTALLMAHARGVICLAARQRGVTLLTLAPAEVKRAVAANGAASKEQVQHCVQRLLRLPALPRPSHVADALALAFTGYLRAGGRAG
jgi:crossover junction endodeoxyribonuclease RuvC